MTEISDKFYNLEVLDSNLDYYEKLNFGSKTSKTRTL